MVSVPAKVILCGEHAVVYGFPAVAVPVFSLRVTVSVESSEDFRIELLDTDEFLSSDDYQHPFVDTVMRTCRSLSVSLPNSTFRVRSDIPIGSGLGSGASIAAALTKGIFEFFSFDLDYTKINNIVYQTEKAFHGTPSGIDNTVIVYETPILFIKGKTPQTIQFNGEYHLLIGDTGVPGSTKETVAHVRSQYKAFPKHTQHTLNQIGSLVNQAHQALSTGKPETLGKLLTENHKQLQKLGVSIDELDTLVGSALQAGAYGAKLSGGGGGGNMIALVPSEKKAYIKDALLKAGAKQVYETSLG